jgi:hypothetical protein
MLKDFDLNVPERLIIATILPSEGNLLTIRLIRDLKRKVTLNAEEIHRYKAKQVETGVQFDPAGLLPIKIKLYPAEVDLIKKQLKDLEEKGKLKEELLGIYEKFFEMPQDEVAPVETAS